ncbi:STAS domain-containing protein [Streptomyces violascens]|uniref:Anti-sigma factor antagonist n=1 Tax=Streptomyces violascens TaxID=67381 RepID=A0ABQ3QXJ3_9ACTN|nr:hypothetical protein GCM10010289_39400 [Streptomyces violascens]GHI41990.1 hypothetical protein Sviol_63980 [Streptomyces violascens]
MDAAAHQPLHLAVVDGLDAVLVRVQGDLDIETAPRLRAALTPLLHRRVELDLSEVSFIDSSGITVLLVHQRHARVVGGRSRVIHVSQPVQRILRLLSFSLVLWCFGVDG